MSSGKSKSDKEEADDIDISNGNNTTNTKYKQQKKHSESSKESKLKRIPKTEEHDHNNNKRKYNECGDTDNYEPQQTKKRKLNTLNDKAMDDKLRYLYKRTCSSKGESLRYKRERDLFEKEKKYYQQQMIHYKNKYIKLKTTVHKFLNHNTSSINKEDEDNDIDIIDINNKENDNNYTENEKSSIALNNDNRNNPLETNINHENIEHITNNKPSSIDIKNEEIQLIDTINTADNTDNNNHLELVTNNNDNNGDNKNNSMLILPSLEDGTLENIHSFSVKCHFCAQSFDDEDIYSNHLKQHYDDNERLKWLHCEQKDCKYIASNKYVFIAHIVTHTGDKMDDLEKKEVLNLPSLEAIGSENDDNYSWDECHFVSVDCKYCKDEGKRKHFDDFAEYAIHIKRHFDRDEDKEWLHCDECDKISTGKNAFMAHLSKHGHCPPFHCSLRIDGKKCKRTAALKSNLISHLEGSKHNLTLKRRKYKKKVSEKKKKKKKKKDIKKPISLIKHKKNGKTKKKNKKKRNKVET